MDKPRFMKLSDSDLADIKADAGALNVPVIEYDADLQNAYCNADHFRAWRASQVQPLR